MPLCNFSGLFSLSISWSYLYLRFLSFHGGIDHKLFSLASFSCLSCSFINSVGRVQFSLGTVLSAVTAIIRVSIWCLTYHLKLFYSLTIQMLYPIKSLSRLAYYKHHFSGLIFYSSPPPNWYYRSSHWDHFLFIYLPFPCISSVTQLSMALI